MNILLADDDRVFQLALGKTLPKWGYQPIVVGNGEEALHHLTSPAGPSIAILDWVMPLVDGIEVCRCVRSSNLSRYVYIILLTSKASSEDLMAGLEAGADDYLAKPVNPQELKLRLRAGCRVLESQARHRHIAENASDGIVIVDEGNRIRFANDAAGAIFGYPRNGLLDLDFSTLAPDFEKHLDDAGARLVGVGNNGGRMSSSVPLEIIGKHQSGRSVILEISFSESPDNEQERLTAMIRDVTERRRLEGQRSQAQKLESIGQLAAGVAHEINTPIQYIGDNLQFIRDSWTSLQPAAELHRRLYQEVRDAAINPATIDAIRSREEAEDFEYLGREVPCALDEALEGVRQVAKIVRAMKEFAHPGSVEMVPTDLNHLVETTVLVGRNQWKSVADLNMDLDPALPFVPCVAGELGLVLLNLVVNGADAISDALKDRSEARGTITITTRVADHWAEIRVADSGTGIPLSVQSRIFDPFFTTKEVGKGTGQGLALAHVTVVQKHHGTIDFETTIGVGTTFIIRLPLAAVEDIPIAAHGAAPGAHPD